MFLVEIFNNTVCRVAEDLGAGNDKTVGIVAEEQKCVPGVDVNLDARLFGDHDLNPVTDFSGAVNTAGSAFARSIFAWRDLLLSGEVYEKCEKSHKNDARDIIALFDKFARVFPGK